MGERNDLAPPGQQSGKGQTGNSDCDGKQCRGQRVVLKRQYDEGVAHGAEQEETQVFLMWLVVAPAERGSEANEVRRGQQHDRPERVRGGEPGR